MFYGKTSKGLIRTAFLPSAFVSKKEKGKFQGKKTKHGVEDIMEKGEQVHFLLSYIGFIGSSMFNSTYLINIGWSLLSDIVGIHSEQWF